PPPALQHHAWAALPGLPGRSRKGGPARSGGPPFVESPGVARNPSRRRGGGPLTSEINGWRSTGGDQHVEINTTVAEAACGTPRQVDLVERPECAPEGDDARGSRAYRRHRADVLRGPAAVVARRAGDDARKPWPRYAP